MITRPTMSVPECGAPITKTGWVTLRALTMRMWRGGINRVIGAGLRKAGWGGERCEMVQVSPVPYSVYRPRKLTPWHYYPVS